MEKWKKYLKSNRHSRHHKKDRCDIKVIVVFINDSDKKEIIDSLKVKDKI